MKKLSSFSENPLIFPIVKRLKALFFTFFSKNEQFTKILLKEKAQKKTTTHKYSYNQYSGYFLFSERLFNNKATINKSKTPVVTGKNG